MRFIEYLKQLFFADEYLEMRQLELQIYNLNNEIRELKASKIDEYNKYQNEIKSLNGTVMELQSDIDMLEQKLKVKRKRFGKI